PRLQPSSPFSFLSSSPYRLCDLLSSPSRRSSDLLSSRRSGSRRQFSKNARRKTLTMTEFSDDDRLYLDDLHIGIEPIVVTEFRQDRKSTRLNSSHVAISYAVFCVNKKIQSPRSHP